MEVLRFYSRIICNQQTMISVRIKLVELEKKVTVYYFLWFRYQLLSYIALVLEGGWQGGNMAPSTSPLYPALLSEGNHSALLPALIDHLRQVWFEDGQRRLVVGLGGVNWPGGKWFLNEGSYLQVLYFWYLKTIFQAIVTSVYLDTWSKNNLIKTFCCSGPWKVFVSFQSSSSALP